MFYVFVDTQVFRANAFAFETNAALLSLRTGVADGRIALLTTTITDREIERLISRDMKEAAQALKRVTKEKYILKTLPVIDLAFLRSSPDESAQRAVELWRAYRTALAPETVGFDTVRPSEVMDLHFAEDPPFSAKKPDEFRDAFVLKALEEWAAAHDRQVLVVSGDADHAEFCDGTRLVHVKSLGEAIEQSRDDEAIAQQARDALFIETDVFKEQLGEVIGELAVSIEDDPDAETEDHEVKEVAFNADEFVLVDFRDGYLIMTGPVRATYTFNTTINDYANGSMDEGEWMYLPHETYAVEAVVNAQVAVRMTYSGAPPQPHVESVAIEAPLHVSVGLHDRDVRYKVTGSWADDRD